MKKQRKLEKKLIKLLALRIIESLEKRKPNGRVLINLFNTGVLIDSNRVRKSTLSVLKKYVKRY